MVKTFELRYNNTLFIFKLQEDLPLELDFQNIVLALSIFFLLVKELSITIVCLEPSTLRFKPPIILLLSKNGVERFKGFSFPLKIVL